MDASRVKSLLTEMGFVEYKPRAADAQRDASGEPTRTSYEAVPTAGIGVLLVVDTLSGTIKIIFAERSFRFSALGLAKRDFLIEQMRSAFGERVVSIRDLGASSPS